MVPERCLIGCLHRFTAPSSFPPLPRPLRLLSLPPAEHLIFVLNLINTTAQLLLPCFIILHTKAELLPGFALTMAVCVLWLKLVSYAHVNWDYRWLWVGRRGGQEGRAGRSGRAGGLAVVLGRQWWSRGVWGGRQFLTSVP